jgi:hypothetical protein
MGIVFGKTGVKEPPFTLIRSYGDKFELRRYGSLCLAEVDMNTVQENGGFRVLAKYIGVFGNPENFKRETIDMTAPVITQVEDKKREGQQLDMTAPVFSNGGRSGTMAFVMPFEYNMNTLPLPTDERVHLKEIPSKLVAVKTFSGWYSDDEGKRQYTELQTDLEEHGLSDAAIDAIGSNGVHTKYTVAQYHPPMTLGPLRKNELWIELDENIQSVQNVLSGANGETK